MSGFDNGLTDAETERLALLSEELAESIQAVSKILRHGFESFNPTLPEDQQITNRDALEKELGHVAHAVRRMWEACDINAERIERAAIEKRQSIGRWLHHQ